MLSCFLSKVCLVQNENISFWLYFLVKKIILLKTLCILQFKFRDNLRKKQLFKELLKRSCCTHILTLKLFYIRGCPHYVTHSSIPSPTPCKNGGLTLMETSKKRGLWDHLLWYWRQIWQNFIIKLFCPSKIFQFLCFYYFYNSFLL